MGPELYVNIIGHPGVGKSRAVAKLAKHEAIAVIKPSDLIRDYASQNGFILASREDYVQCHAQMRRQNPTCFTDPALNSNSLVVVYDGLRVPADVATLRASKKTIVIALLAPIAIRYSRADDNREERGNRDHASIQAFKRDEQYDYFSPSPDGPNVLQVIREADVWINTAELTRLETVNAVTDVVTASALAAVA